jgi:hypothetical protein
MFPEKYVTDKSRDWKEREQRRGGGGKRGFSTEHEHVFFLQTTNTNAVNVFYTTDHMLISPLSIGFFFQASASLVARTCQFQAGGLCTGGPDDSMLTFICLHLYGNFVILFQKMAYIDHTVTCFLLTFRKC